MFLRLLLTVFIAISCCSDGLALTAAESIARFQTNEVRIDTFVNDEGYYTTTGGDRVETLPSLVLRKDAEISQRYNVEAKGAWLTATAYVVNDVVTDTGVVYLCVVAHTSGTFATDLAAGKWIPYQMALPFGQYCDTETAVIATNADAAMAQIIATNDYELKADLTIAAGKIYSAIPGAIVSTKYSIRSAAYRWVLTGSGTAEYRCELAAGTDPGFSQPTAVWINGAEAMEGTAGALNSGEWDYSGGYIIARMGADSDPDAEALGYVEVHYTLDLSLAKVEDNGGQMFSSSSGDVILTLGTIDPVNPHLWGTGTTAVQCAITACPTYGTVRVDKDYTCDAITGKPDITIEGTSGRTTNSLPQTLTYSGSTGDFVTLGTDGGAPVAGMTFRNIALDGNGTTGAVIAMAAWRSQITRCYITNAAEGVTYFATSSWAGENSIDGGCYFNNLTKAINNENETYGPDNVVKDNWIFPGVGTDSYGLYALNIIGWEVTGNHFYTCKINAINGKGYAYNIHHNYVDGVYGGNAGIYIENTSASVWGKIESNIITMAVNNDIGIHLVSTSTGKVSIALNNISESGGVTGTVGIKTTGVSTFYGTVALNTTFGLDTEYSLHSGSTTEFMAFSSGALYINSAHVSFGSSGTVAANRFRPPGKNTTANRPTLTTADIGTMYMDTTLDADGLPIWWNGLKWIKYDGSDA